MNRVTLEKTSWAMAEVYGAVTDRILINLAKYFPFIKDSSQVSGSYEYQARMLAQMGQVNRETIEIIMQSLNGADEALRESLVTAITDGLKTEEPKLHRAAENGLLNGSGYIPTEPDPARMQAFRTYYSQSSDKLNLVDTVILESTQAAFRETVSDIAGKIIRAQDILNIAAGGAVSGVTSYNQAVHDAVKQMVANGLTGFVDRAGRRWSPEAYVAMDIRTTMFNVARAAVWERNAEYGIDTYLVSSHTGARPLCYPWQGKVISRIDWARDITDKDGNPVHVYAQSETTYGQAAGLFGVNCGHYPITFIPGVSAIRGVQQTQQENERSYEESQEQRALERRLREEKLYLQVLTAQGAPEEKIKYQRNRVQAASKEIDVFCKETGRSRDYQREYTPVKAEWPD